MVTFSRNELVRQHLEQLQRQAAGLGRGDEMLYPAIERILGPLHPRHGFHWRTVIGKFRVVLLRERGIQLVAMTNRGYRLATAEEQVTALAVAGQKKVARALRGHEKQVEGPRPDELTMELLNLQAQKLGSIARQVSDLKRERDWQFRLGPTPTNARPPRPVRSSGQG